MTTPSSTRTAVSTQVTAEGQNVTFQQIERMANAVAKSGLFGIKTPEQAMALMMIAQAEGRSPATAAQDYHVIQGRPALKADTMLARFQAAGGKVNWTEYTDAKVVGVFMHPQGGSVAVDWDMARAQRAGLANKDNWKNYPRAQMRARCISEGVRTVYPGIAQGIYTVEETQDMVDVTPTKQQEEMAKFQKEITDTGLTQAEVDEHLAAIKAAADMTALKAAFETAWVHAKTAQDEPNKQVFKGAYDVRKGELGVAT